MALRRDGFSSLSFPQWQPNCFPSSRLSSLIFLLCYFLIDLFSICLSAAHREPLSRSRIPPETQGETKQLHKHPLCHTTNAHAHKRQPALLNFQQCPYPKWPPKTPPPVLSFTLCASLTFTHMSTPTLASTSLPFSPSTLIVAQKGTEKHMLTSFLSSPASGHLKRMLWAYIKTIPFNRALFNLFVQV